MNWRFPPTNTQRHPETTWHRGGDCLVESGSIVLMSAPRPRAVTLACIYAGLAGAMLLISFLDLATGWNSLEVQERVRSILEAGGFGGSFDVETMMPMVRTAASIGAFLAMTVIVFAIFTARGDRSSRIALTILTVFALVVFAAGGIAGLIPAVLAIMVLTFLWSKPSREWFAVVNSTEPLDLVTTPDAQSGHRHGRVEPPKREPNSRVAGGVSAPKSDQKTPVPLKSPTEYFGDSATGPEAVEEQDSARQSEPSSFPAQSSLAFPGGMSATPVSQVPVSEGPMPTKLKIVLWLAGVGALVTAGLSALILLAMTAMRGEVLAEVRKTPELMEQLETTGLSAETLLTVMVVLASLWLAAAILACIAIGLVFTRKAYAWWVLLFALLVPLGLSIPVLPFGLITAIPLVAVLVVVIRADVREWFM